MTTQRDLVFDSRRNVFKNFVSGTTSVTFSSVSSNSMKTAEVDNTEGRVLPYLVYAKIGSNAYEPVDAILSGVSFSNGIPFAFANITSSKLTMGCNYQWIAGTVSFTVDFRYFIFLD